MHIKSTYKDKAKRSYSLHKAEIAFYPYNSIHAMKKTSEITFQHTWKVIPLVHFKKMKHFQAVLFP